MAVVTVKVATDNGARGGALHLTLSAAREVGDGSLASLNTDVIFDTAQLDLVGACSSGAACHTSGDCGAGDFCRFAGTACEKDPRLTDQTVEVIPPDFQNVPPGGPLCPAGAACRRIRFAIVATRLPVPTFTDGRLVTCTFQVLSSAPLGPVTLSTDRLQVADNAVPAKAVPAQMVIEAGQITVAATPTATGSPSPSGTPTPTIGSPTATATSTTPTATPTHGTATPTGPSPTPTGGGQQCSSPRPAPAGPAVYVVDQNFTAAGPVTVEVKLAAGGAQVAGTQNDLTFDANVRINVKVNGKPDCTVNPAIMKNGTSFGFRAPGCSGAACTAVRALVLATDGIDPIPDGSTLYTCNATVTNGTGTLANTGVILSDPTGTRISNSTGREGIFCVAGAQSPTATPTVTGGTTTATPSRTIMPSSTPTTLTPTRTPVTPSRTPAGTGNGGGGGCNCSINAIDQAGVSSFWLVGPAALLFWRRRSRG